MAASRERLGCGEVLGLALRLEVRRVRTGNHRPFVPIEAKPPQAVENAADHGLRRSLDVGVLDAEHEHAAVAAGEQPVEERGAGAADVKVTSGRRRETDPGRRHNP